MADDDLFASNTNPDAVWNKQFCLPTNYAIRGTEYCCAAVNMTALVASQNDMIFVLDFASNNK
jgi:hypothetical protein